MVLNKTKKTSVVQVFFKLPRELRALMAPAALANLSMCQRHTCS
jgi:hypothetical protein